MQRVPLYLIAAGVLGASGSAFADDASPPGATPAAPTTADSAAAAPTMIAGALNDRPLVAPKGAFDVHGTVPFLAVETVDIDGMGNETTSTTLGIGLTGGVDYGVVDKVEVGGEYSLSLKPGDATGFLNVHGAYAALHSDKLDLAIAADIGFDLHSNGEIGLSIGAWARYHVAPKFSVFTGNPGLPHSTELGGGGLLGFFANGSYQLAFGLNDGNTSLLTVPVGVGYQATPQIYAFASTTLAAFALNNGNSAYLFSDFIPIEVGAFYQASDKLDVGVEFSDDLKNAGDFYDIAVTARYWVK